MSLSLEEEKVIVEIADKVYPIFQEYGWKWKNKIPTLKEIRECLEFLYKEARDSKREMIETGRIRVERDEDLSCYTFYLELGEIEFGEE